MVRSFIAAIMVGMCVTALPAGARSCAFTMRSSVILRSSDFDPDVLVWDTRRRAIDYVGGNIKSTSEVLVHTVLSKPGTKAQVIACDPRSSKPRYSAVAEDTVGIKILTGPNKGRFGWVSSDDAHAGIPRKTATP